MDFFKLLNERYSCRNFSDEQISHDELERLIEAARLAPSACNSQEYFFYVATGRMCKELAKATQAMGLNKFTDSANAMIVVCEKPYNLSANVGSKLKDQDFRSVDIGIASSIITLEAANLGLGTCILGWFDEKKIRSLLGTKDSIRLLIAVGKPLDRPREKKRKSMDELRKFVE